MALPPQPRLEQNNNTPHFSARFSQKKKILPISEFPGTFHFEVIDCHSHVWINPMYAKQFEISRKMLQNKFDAYSWAETGAQV